jgi:hypothetical protein
MKKHTGKILIIALATITAIIYFIASIEINKGIPPTPIEEELPLEEMTAPIQDSLPQVSHLEKEKAAKEKRKPEREKTAKPKAKVEKEKEKAAEFKERRASNELE